ncbi:MAG: DUF1513 domain-containing protein [Pseudomonadota bacterium]|nr:DUF1513 domain-containing protein [Pseudomonadota bacterium]
MTRRQLLGAGAALAGTAALGGWTVWSGRGQSPLLLSARNDSAGKHYAVGYHLAGRRAFATPVTERCHDVCRHPFLPLALYVGRRPSRESYLVDLRDGTLLQTLVSEPDRHFYGHAVFHGSGEWLYTTENDTTDPGRGVLGRYRLDPQHRQLVHAGEASTHGVGPHQLAWLPDGESLVIGNGGIRTEGGSRKEMNLDAMAPSLVIMDRHGALISKETLPQSQNSIRHLAVAADGTVITGQQYHGPAWDSVPLLAIKRPGQPYQPFPVSNHQLAMMNQYTASIAIHSEKRLVAMTAPRGNRFFIWDLDSAATVVDTPMSDCAGVGAVPEGFAVTSGQGKCRFFDCSGSAVKSQWLALPDGGWDNHLGLG